MAILNKQLAGMRELKTEEITQVAGGTGTSTGTMCDVTDEVNGTITDQYRTQDDAILD